VKGGDDAAVGPGKGLEELQMSSAVLESCGWEGGRDMMRIGDGQCLTKA